MSYEVYIKRKWDKAKYKPIQVKTDLSNVANNTIGICNTLNEISSAMLRLKNSIDSSEFKRKADAIALQVDQIEANFGKKSTNNVRDIQNIITKLAVANNRLGGDMDFSSRRMSNIDMLLGRYK